MVDSLRPTQVAIRGTDLEESVIDHIPQQTPTYMHIIIFYRFKPAETKTQLGERFLISLPFKFFKTHTQWAPLKLFKLMDGPNTRTQYTMVGTLIFS